MISGSNILVSSDDSKQVVFVLKFDVVGIGNALVDVLVRCDYDWVEELGLQPRVFNNLAEKELLSLEQKIKGFDATVAPGGSAANTIGMLSQLGSKTLFCGKVGLDQTGSYFVEKMRSAGIFPHIRKSPKPSGKVITFITPDSERTFAAHLGAALMLSKEDVPIEQIQSARMLHVEGYLLDDPRLQKPAVHAMKIANDSNVPVSLDLGDPGVVSRNKNRVRQIVGDHVSVLFSNEPESKAFTGEPVESSLKLMADAVDIAVIKKGIRGSVIQSAGNRVEIPSFRVNAVDSTGAGDAYAAGFLYGCLDGRDIKTSGMLGSFLASKVVEVLGSRASTISLESIQSILRSGDAHAK